MNLSDKIQRTWYERQLSGCPYDADRPVWRCAFTYKVFYAIVAYVTRRVERQCRRRRLYVYRRSASFGRLTYDEPELFTTASRIGRKWLASTDSRRMRQLLSAQLQQQQQVAAAVSLHPWLLSALNLRVRVSYILAGVIETTARRRGASAAVIGAVNYTGISLDIILLHIRMG